MYAGLPKYDQYPKSQSYKSNLYYSNYNIGTLISSTPNPPLKSTLGYHIGYTNVTETRSDNSQIVFSYVNGHPTNFYLKYPAAPPSYDFGSGELKSSTYKDDMGINKYFLTISDPKKVALIQLIRLRSHCFLAIIIRMEIVPNCCPFIQNTI